MLVRLRQGESFRLLDDFLLVGKQPIIDAFYESLFIFAADAHDKFKTWNTKNMDNDTKDRLYTQIWDDMGPMERF